MEKIFRKKIPKVRSKKGMSLVELLVGITIIAIVFASSAGSIVTGYKTTVDNAERNTAAAVGASLNELIMQGIRNCDFENRAACEEYFFGTGSPAKDPNTDGENSIHQMTLSLDSSTKFVLNASYPNSQDDVQYTIDPAATSQVTISGVDKEIKGVLIKTAVNSSAGMVFNTSFVAYTSQD